MSGNAAKQLTAYKKGISPSVHLTKFKTPTKLPAEGASKVKAPKKRVQVVESAVESVATAEQYGVFKGSTMYDLGGGCAVLGHRRTCGRSLELSVATYIFRMDILVIQKRTVVQNRERNITYARLDRRKGHRSFIPGMEKDGVGSLQTATPHKAAEIQSVVFLFLQFEVISNDEVAAGPALDSVQRQALLLANESSRVGHYQLMAMQRDDADEGPSGSGKKVAKKKHRSHNGAAGAADEGSKDTSDQDTDQDDWDNADPNIQKLRDEIRDMKKNEYDFLHNAKKKQKQHDDAYNLHTGQMEEHADSSDTHIVRDNKHLRDIAACNAKKIEEMTNDNMHEISMAQAQLKEFWRKSQHIEDPNDELFDTDLEYYMIKARKRHAKNIEQHKHHAAAQKSAAAPKCDAAPKSAANYDIAGERQNIKENEEVRLGKIQRSHVKTQGYETQLNAILSSLDTPENRSKIEKIEANIQVQVNYRRELEVYQEATQSRLAYLEAANNGAGDMWIEANPRLVFKYGNLRPHGL